VESTFVVLFTLIIDYSTTVPIVPDSLKTQKRTRTRRVAKCAYALKGRTRLFHLLRTPLRVCLVKVLMTLVHSQGNRGTSADNEDNDATQDDDDVITLIRFFITPTHSR
jgi:hypothetical protein